jgi:DNA-binding MarR family transcriptional regulator
MPVKFKFKNLDKGSWVLLRQAYNLIVKCEDQVFGEYELTTEKHAVLMAIKHINGPVRITDIARWLDRSVNSVSMIIDRMVKAGLVRRVRDRKDRRTVFVTMTPKAEQAYVPSTVAGWGLIQEILAPLSEEDKRTLIRMLETLRDKTYDYLDSGKVVEEVSINEKDTMAQFMKGASEYKLSSTTEAKSQRGTKKRITR